MTNERCGFTLTLLPNGKVLAAGGQPMIRMNPEELEEVFLKHAGDHQLKYLNPVMTKAGQFQGKSQSHALDAHWLSDVTASVAGGISYLLFVVAFARPAIEIRSPGLLANLGRGDEVMDHGVGGQGGGAQA